MDLTVHAPPTSKGTADHHAPALAEFPWVEQGDQHAVQLPYYAAANPNGDVLIEIVGSSPLLGHDGMLIA
jgi:hypothetical protein